MGSRDHRRCRNYLGVISRGTEAVTRRGSSREGRSVGGQRASPGGLGWEGEESGGRGAWDEPSTLSLSKSPSGFSQST